MDTLDIVNSKKDLRKVMLKNRLNIPVDAKQHYDAWICDELLKIIKQREVKVVHAYLPMGKEIDITALIDKLLKLNIKVITPKTLPKRVLENRVLHSLSSIEKGVFGTTHPLEKDVYEGPFDFVIVPGLAFDENNFRLGYGGGYYDNFLVNHEAAYKVGIFYPFQKVDQVPLEAHDLRLDVILNKPF